MGMLIINRIRIGPSVSAYRPMTEYHQRRFWFSIDNKISVSARRELDYDLQFWIGYAYVTACIISIAMGH